MWYLLHPFNGNINFIELLVHELYCVNLVGVVVPAAPVNDHPNLVIPVVPAALAAPQCCPCRRY